jgi:hypothetical protein
MLNVFIKHSLLAALFISIATLSLSLSPNTKISVFLFRYPEIVIQVSAIKTQKLIVKPIWLTSSRTFLTSPLLLPLKPRFLFQTTRAIPLYLPLYHPWAKTSSGSGSQNQIYTIVSFEPIAKLGLRCVNPPSRDLPKVSLHVAKLPTSAANSSTQSTTNLVANHVSNLSISETFSPSPTAAYHAAHHAANLPISAAFLRRPEATSIPKGKKSTSTRQLRTNLFYHSISRALQVKSNEQGSINPQCQCDTKGPNLL